MIPRPFRSSLPALCAAVLSLGLSLSLSAQAPVVIGSWNLEFLGDPGNHRTTEDAGKRRDLPPRTAEDLQRIGAFVRDLGVSALAIQEVCGPDAAAALAAAIGPEWRSVLGTTGGWNDGKTFQSIGFVYDDARLELLWAEELLDFPRERDGLPIFHRVPVTACFRDRRSGLDFRAVTVHLKASMKPDDLKKRALEATVLRDWLLLLENAPGEDQDIVLMGDFNSTYGTEPEQVLESAGVVRYLPQVRPEPTIMHFPEPIDQIAPSPRFTEVDATTFDAHGEAAAADPLAWRQTFSDHFPVTVALRAERDDDPDAGFAHGPADQRLPVALRGDAAPAATPAMTASVATPGSALAVGARVEVAFVDMKPVRGRLLEPLGDWVVLRTEVGELVRAFPAHLVREVRLLAP